MSTHTTTTAAESYVGHYGPAVTYGILSEHLSPAGLADRTRVLANGALVALVPQGHRADLAIPVLCGELIPWADEDGPTVIRCGRAVSGGPEGYACEGHTEERESYLALSEAERCFLERREDEERF